MKAGGIREAWREGSDVGNVHTEHIVSIKWNEPMGLFHCCLSLRIGRPYERGTGTTKHCGSVSYDVLYPEQKQCHSRSSKLRVLAVHE
jgi:hypothetical protein